MKRLLLLLVLLVTAFQGFSQTKGISYQAVDFKSTSTANTRSKCTR